MSTQTTQRGEKLVRSFQAFTELPSVGVRLSHFRSSLTFRDNERYAQGDIHVHFALETLRGLGERLE